MSKCMTIADETVDQKDICLDIAPKDIVEIILEEALLSALIVSDKGCSRIGDSNITDEFRQQYDQLSSQKDFEQVEPSQAQPAANKDSNLNFRENSDRAVVPARGNLEQIIDSFVKEEKIKPLNDCQIISEEVLADSELQIKNGQIRLEKNKTEKTISDSARHEYFDKKDVIKDEKIEIEYFNEGQLNKIYVPLNLTNSTTTERDHGSKKEEGVSEKEEEENAVKEQKEDAERPFKPFLTEELRESSLLVWENENSSLVGKWDGDMWVQKEKVIKIMEELSSVQVFPDSLADPNRPRAYTFGEEDVKKMTKEIEDINFNQSRANSENSMSYYPDGQGDADLESENIEKSQNEFFNSPNFKNNPERDQNQLEKEIQSQIYQKSPNIVTAINPKKENCINDSNNEMRTSIEEMEGSSEEVKKFESLFSTQLQPDVEDSMNTKNSKLFQKDYVNMKKDNVREFPNTMSKSTGSLIETKKDEITVKRDMDLTPDLDVKYIQEEPSAIMLPDTRDILSNHQTQQGTLSWDRLNWGSKEILSTLSSNAFLEEEQRERILVDYNPLTEEAEGKLESNDAENFLQESQSPSGGPKSNSGIIQNGEDANLNAENTNERLEETLVCAEKNIENFEKLEKKVSGDETESIKVETEEESSKKDATFEFTQTSISAQSGKKTLNSVDRLSNTESNQGSSNSSQTSQIVQQVHNHSTHENEVSSGSEALVGGSQKLKLHSQKMYLSPYHEPAGQDFNLTESEEAFIDMSENVIQIIDPPENSTDEEFSEISFSLLAGKSNLKSAFPKVDTDSELSLKEKDFSETETSPKRVYSGMTTIGPIKTADYDPKDLSAAEVDYGKMTRIKSSRQLARDMGLLNSENPALSVKIIEEDDSDDDTSLNLEDEHVDRNSLINRDIASLTKVQKVREVMSHQAKPDEDFEDEESLPRPRLDLKDVESMTDERYKFPDVSIPLLSFEIGDRNLDAEKELIESMGLVISGLTNPCFYEDELEDNAEIQTNDSSYENESNAADHLNLLVGDKKNSKTESINEEEIIPTNGEKEEIAGEFAEKSSEKEILDRKDSQHENSENSKYSTLGSVFRKASSKFMRKDSELCRRNSKSLPRDANKISATNSIRSILDDCQSSASNMLKKSCSLLKNTESIFKSISQSMVTSDRSSGSSTTQKKLSPSESDVSTIERKFSGFFKKEDFTKAKNLIKSKVEKKFKTSDKESSSPCETEISSEKEELRLVVRNEENLRIDRIENFKKLLPKSPLVYKSQFVKSQMNFQSSPEPEPEAAVNTSAAEKEVDETVNAYPVEANIDVVPASEKEFHEEVQPTTICPQENLQWIIQKEELKLPINEHLESQQPDFIVMETIQGLPAADLESPSAEKEHLIVGNTTTKKGNDLKIEATYSLQIVTGSSHDIAPRFPETDEEKAPTKTPSERKIKTKKKKFTARLRSFWCSAFGRAKTPEKKGDLS